MATETPVVLAAANTCKRAIRDAVDLALCEFRLTTGVAPSGVDIDMVDATRVGQIVHDYLVVNVRLRFDL